MEVRGGVWKGRWEFVFEGFGVFGKGVLIRFCRMLFLKCVKK